MPCIFAPLQLILLNTAYAGPSLTVILSHLSQTCAKCDKRQKCTKSFSIQKFPRILVVHLKRFSPQERYRGKLNSVVDFPLCGLDLSSYSEGQGPCRYVSNRCLLYRHAVHER